MNAILSAVGLVFCASLVLPACRTAEDANRAEVERLEREHERYLRTWSAEQLRFSRENPTPRTLDFGLHGTLIVREAELVGLPGREKLRVPFTFVNTTGVSMESAKATLLVVDEENDLEWGEVMQLRLPFGFDFTHNSSYTGVLEAPLRGLHRRSDWTWRMELEAGARDVPAGVEIPE